MRRCSRRINGGIGRGNIRQCTGALNPSGRLRKPNRNTHLHQWAGFGIDQRLHHAVSPHLRVAHALFGSPGEGVRHIRLLEALLPMGVRLGENGFGDARSQLEVRLRRLRNLPATEARTVQHVADAHNLGRGLDEAKVNTAELHVAATGAGVDAVKWATAGRMGLEGPRLQVRGHHFRLIQQAARHQRRLDGPSPTRLLPGQKRRRNADGGEQRRADAGQRMHHVHRAGTVPRHGFQDAHARHDQLVLRRLVLEWTSLAVGGDGAVNQSRIERGEPVGAHQGLLARRGREVFKNNIGAAK